MRMNICMRLQKEMAALKKKLCDTIILYRDDENEI